MSNRSTFFPQNKQTKPSSSSQFMHQTGIETTIMSQQQQQEQQQFPEFHIDEKDIDVMNASCALYCKTSTLYMCVACACFPFCYYLIKSQDITMNDRKMHMKYDNGCQRADNYLPLERIQDVDISQDCCSRMFSVKDIVISTAGGTPISVYGLKNTEQFRDEVLRRRDALVHGGGHGGGLMTDGTSSNVNVTAFKVPPSQELVEMKEALLRIEKQIERGLNKF